MSLEVEIVDDVSARLAAAPTALRTGLAGVADVLGQMLLDRARALAGGEVLQVRSGQLVDSLAVDVAAGAGGFVARLSNAAPYAAILEYGGEIPAHEIAPDKAKALKFRRGAGEVFAATVRVPEVHIPEHSFMRAALDDEESLIARTLVDEVDATLLALLG